MRNYQRKKKNPYLLPHNLYMRTLYIIKDYERLREEYCALLEESPSPSYGLPRGSGTGDPTARIAQRRVIVSEEIKAVEQALFLVPEEYREGVWENIVSGAWYPRDAGVRTYQYWKQRYIYGVAEKMKLR